MMPRSLLQKTHVDLARTLVFASGEPSLKESWALGNGPCIYLGGEEIVSG